MEEGKTAKFSQILMISGTFNFMIGATRSLETNVAITLENGGNVG
jgi:hypothetical protein